MKAFGTLVVVLMLACGAGLLGYARWSRVIVEADAALAADRLEEALAAYEQAELRFDRTPAARQLLAREYNRLASNHMWVLYRLGRYDDTIDAAERAPLEAGPHFWSGSAFFQKARTEEKPETRLGWLARAEDEFRKAVEASPDDWDTKFNYELTARLAAALRKNPKAPPSQMMQLLRPPTTGARTPRRVG
jgi:tetratricopeptide (TPR) repeat protein